jgi:purine-binding chemotaxis protein CheW
MDEDSAEKQPAARKRRAARTFSGDKAVVFDVGGYSSGLPLEHVREIVPMCDLARPPGHPPVLEGLLNLRGRITPVVRLDRLFGLAPVVLRRHTQLVVLQGLAPLALLSERVRNVAVVAQDELLPTPEDSVFNDCLAAVLPAAYGSIHLLYVERLLLAEEKQRIAELQQIAQRRLAELEEVRP